MEYAIPLFILADEVYCGEAIDNCLRFISENLNIHQYWDSHHFHTEISETWRLLVKEKNLGKNSKAKLMGLKVIKDLNKKNCDSDRARTELNIIAGVLMDFNCCNCKLNLGEFNFHPTFIFIDYNFLTSSCALLQSFTLLYFSLQSDFNAY